MKYALIISLIISIILLSSNKIEKYTNNFLDQMKKTDNSTEFNDEGQGNVAFLDRHNVKCKGLLTQFRLTRDGQTKYKYKYNCLDVNDKVGKLKTFPVKQTSKVIPTKKTTDLINKQMNCHDPNDPDVGLVGFVYKNGDGKAWYEYTCGKFIPKTKEEIKAEADILAKKDAEIKKAKDALIKKRDDSRPNKPGCYVYSDDNCPKNNKFNTKGKWHHDVRGEQMKGAGDSEKECRIRTSDYNTMCGSSDFVHHFKQFPGKKTKEYSHGKGNTVFLDGHDIDCGDKFIKSVVLKPKGNDNYSYHYKCSDDPKPIQAPAGWSFGDASSKKEISLGKTNNATECYDLVRSKEPSANAVTYGTSDDKKGLCYAEFEATGINKNNNYITRDIKNTPPSKPGCYIYSNENCPRQKKFNTKGKWHHLGVKSKENRTAHLKEASCKKRNTDYNKWCGSTDFKYQWNKPT